MKSIPQGDDKSKSGIIPLLLWAMTISVVVTDENTYRQNQKGCIASR